MGCRLCLLGLHVCKLCSVCNKSCGGEPYCHCFIKDSNSVHDKSPSSVYCRQLTNGFVFTKSRQESQRISLRSMVKQRIRLEQSVLV